MLSFFFWLVVAPYPTATTPPSYFQQATAELLFLTTPPATDIMTLPRPRRQMI
jgi:hypothetical protein